VDLWQKLSSTFSGGMAATLKMNVVAARPQSSLVLSLEVTTKM
jgi:hypothetical protein